MEIVPLLSRALVDAVSNKTKKYRVRTACQKKIVLLPFERAGRLAAGVRIGGKSGQHRALHFLMGRCP